MSRQYVIHDAIRDPRELRRRYRSGSGRPAILLAARPQLDEGDRVTVLLRIKARKHRLQLRGWVVRTNCALRQHDQTERCFQLALDDESIELLRPWLFDVKQDSPGQRRTNRASIQAWSACRVPGTNALRQAKVLDVSPVGVFLATGLESEPGTTIVFKLEKSPTWLAGVVKWQGTKDGASGVGLRLVFSRHEEAASWHRWYAGRLGGSRR